MNSSTTRDKFWSFVISALVFMGVSLLLLTRVSQNWDTARYLAAYLLISALYFSSISLLLGLKAGALIPSGMLSSVVFSLGFMLIKLNGILLEIARPIKIQKIYFQVLLLSFICFVVILTVKIIRAAILAIRERDVKLPLSFYVLFHYVVLMPYTAYELIRAGNSKHNLVVFSSIVISAIVMLVLRNRGIREGLRKSVAYFWNTRRFIIIIFVFALAARVMFAVQLTRNLPAGFMEGPDTQAINDRALDLSRTWNILDSKPSFLDGKGSAVIFYAVIYKLFGENPLYGRLADALLGALCVLLTFYIADRLFGHTAAKIASILTAGYGYLIQYGVYIGTEALGLLSIMVFVSGVLAARDRPGPAAIALTLISGMSLAICVMARSEYYYVIIPAFIWVIIALRKQKAGIVFFAAGFAVLALLWSWRNLLAFGNFTMSDFVTASFKDGWLGRLWRYETEKFAEAGIAVSGIGDMFRQLFISPAVAIKILMPHIIKGFYSFWDYNTFFTTAFIFVEPKEACYNMALCFYLYLFMLAAFFLPTKRRDAVLFLVFILLFKTVSYILTTTPTFYDGGNLIVLFRDWYRFTIIPFTHVFMGGGIAYLIAKSSFVNDRTGKGIT